MPENLHWVGTWTATPAPAEAGAFSNQTLRMNPRISIGGDRVRVLQPPVGGNFGRGLDLYPIDVIAALLARRARRPVKIEFERVDERVWLPVFRAVV